MAEDTPKKKRKTGRRCLVFDCSNESGTSSARPPKKPPSLRPDAIPSIFKAVHPFAPHQSAFPSTSAPFTSSSAPDISPAAVTTSAPVTTSGSSSLLSFHHFSSSNDQHSNNYRVHHVIQTYYVHNHKQAVYLH